MPQSHDIPEVPREDPMLSADALLPLVYDELRYLATRRLRDQSHAVTLQPTVLVHEAWLRMSANPERSWENRAHFFRTAAVAMRSFLVDRARKKARIKRGNGQHTLTLDDFQNIGTPDPEDRILLIDAVMERFEQQAPASARIVSLKFFGGLTNKQIAELDEVSERTIERQWVYARARLYDLIRAAE